VRSDPTMEAPIQDLNGQLAAAINELVQQKSGAIPAQSLVNPKGAQNQ